MSQIDELIERALSKKHFDDEEYWELLVADMNQFLKEDHPEEEKRRLYPIGFLEMANMNLSGIRYRKEIEKKRY